MMKTAVLLMLCGCVLLVDGPASGEGEQPIDCANAMTQMDLTECARLDYDEADTALNAQWKLTKKAMADWDAELGDQMKGGEKALLAAQRAWIAYRDAHCEAEGFQARGGSMEPMLVAGCLATLTRSRTEELKALVEPIGN